MEQPKNPLAIIENLFWEIGRLFILYFITIFSLLFKPMRVINWAIDGDADKKVKYCPPVTYFLLTLAFIIAVSKFVFYQETFDLVKASQIFTNLFLESRNILNISSSYILKSLIHLVISLLLVLGLLQSV
jgi:hypothetical protein